MLSIVVFIVIVALVFDFINGFHDAANSIATVVSTRVLTPLQAVVWAAFFNFVAAFGFGVEGAKTVGKGVVQPSVIDQWVVLAGLVGQLLSAAAYSLGHGTNDAQKTMGIIAVLLFSTGHLGPEFYVPFWVILAAHLAMGLGTMAGGWRIVKTMGMRITKLRPVGGFCAETAGAITLIGTAIGGIPVSTTQTISGSIMGVGAIQRFSAVRWGVAGRILWAWILTIPASALVAALTWTLLRLVGA